VIDDQSENTVGRVPAGTPPPESVGRFRVILVKPSKYDDDGYVMRYLRGVLPSNTLATLAGLTRDVVSRNLLGDVRVDVRMIDETVQRIDVRKLARSNRSDRVRTVVALCGVQTNQFPRAADLAREFRRLGVPVMIGGFHVSGAIAMSRTGMPPECQELIDVGVTVVKGEVEDCWDALLRDALHDSLAPFYDIVDLPDLSGAALPVVERSLLRRFTDSRMGTIDAGRGCPFDCSFCTIINVQGRGMRYRPAARIKELVRSNAARKIDYYFFTDDNFSRNPNWREILDALIELRRDEGIDLHFMMQVDVPAYRNPDFVTRAAEAGCSQVFIGMETVNPKNLPATGKRQNRVERYREMIDTWHEAGIACHVGYIIGFPHDTVSSVRRDVLHLRDEIRVDQASFFMLAPLPGSRDHAEMVQRGEWIDPDYNRYDSFHPTMRHPRMSAEEWSGAYHDAWSEFYSIEGMKSILERTADESYWNVLKNFLWYRYATLVENTHPMIGGFFRLKDRRQRRPGFPRESRWAHYRRRAREMRAWVRGVVGLYYEMQEVWLATRGRPRWQENIEEMRRRYDETAERLSAGVEAVRQRHRPFLARCSRLAIRMDPFRVRASTRTDLNDFWRQTVRKLRRGRVYLINPVALGFNLVRDARLCVRFNLELLASPTR
jgi:radical SAM superfamily enzyme YgiQ (UPF0313 family)